MSLSEEQTMIRDLARDFARNELAPHAAEWDRTGHFPEAEITRLGELGLMGMLVPEEWGGAGADHVSLALVMEEIAAGDAGVSTTVNMQNCVVTKPVYEWGSEEQKQRYLRRLVSAELRGAFMLTEPHTGSDASAIKTRARLEGNKYVLNGNKQFITSGTTAHLAICFAVTDESAGKRGISAFLVPTDAPGYKVLRTEVKLGQNSSDTCQVALEDLELGPDMMLGEPGQGYRIALANLECGRIAIAAQALGIARAAYEAALEYAGERETFGQAIFEHQAVGFKLADMATELEAARALIHHAARLRDGGLPSIKEASMAKLFASEMAERVCSAAIQVHGGYGYLRDFPVERHYRDVRICQIYEGTSEIQRLVIARAIREE
ncbi:MAG TPA: acyl-CoA dehydrogenase family protein [Alphaproteobacteria bacterium]|nr:acyl-CoA dehydrogenase [Acidobacteriota bacterium]MDP6067196.1 acyl-CoA dehydrogenase family protein [Alphaproteobacteria bacterium]MDP6270488.1 acyl-CoA dehydrogenase family protein [Alphaproteobacteria bacterium]MDP7427311.1 acyl-CoA dehydrogenase family protein [Alphaproteobacteria bacterium]HJM50460.1 acyl-CoA dehydrogenase family protein [Alphaproteobacteria bacterium]